MWYLVTFVAGMIAGGAVIFLRGKIMKSAADALNKASDK